MKHFHNLIMVAFLIPLLPLVSAEPGLKERSDVALVDPKEETPLTSLDEELSLLDEEFEEFKEELYSLENDLQQQEKSSLSIPEKILKTEEKDEDSIALEKEIDNLFQILVPEIDSQDQISVQTQLPVIDKIEDQHPTAKSDFAIENNQVQNETIVKNGFPIDESKEVLDTEPFAIEQADTIKELQAIHSQPVLAEEEFSHDASALLDSQVDTQETSSPYEEPMLLEDETIAVDLKQAFEGSPIIYSLLFAMSVVAVGIWLYSILSLRSSARVSTSFIKTLQNKLNSNSFDEALSLCQEQDNLFCKMIANGIHCRRHGLPVMIEGMKAEGKRVSIAFWQKIGLLNDIAIIAPMLGLLGTVLGMFYAFYDINRSIESISTLFDGLGISVGTTVAGLIVAILALILHSTAKYRLIRALTLIENEAQNVATLIDDRTSIYKESST